MARRGRISGATCERLSKRPTSFGKCERSIGRGGRAHASLYKACSCASIGPLLASGQRRQKSRTKTQMPSATIGSPICTLRTEIARPNHCATAIWMRQWTATREDGSETRPPDSLAVVGRATCWRSAGTRTASLSAVPVVSSMYGLEKRGCSWSRSGGSCPATWRAAL